MPTEQCDGNGQEQDHGSRRASVPASTAPRTRKRRPACERCNKRRTRCDGSLVGTPCSACKKSNNHESCAMIESKRRRGADGRYVTHGESIESPNTSMGIEQDSSSPRRQPLPSNSYHALSSPNATNSSTPISGASINRRTPVPSRTPSHVTSMQPNIIGESWYASYVMRGYSPGHASHHRPLDGTNATVQSIAENMQSHTESTSTPDAAFRPGEAQRAATPKAASTTDQHSHDLPPPELVDRLIKAYFARFHTFCPILVRTSFLSSLSNRTVSFPLLCSVLFVASIHCDIETVHLLGYDNRFNANADLMARAVAAFDTDRSSDRTSMFLSSYLLHYWFGNPSAYRDSHWWFAAAVRSAQCMGYHLSTRHTQMAAAERSRWKRVWWCLYVRDRQISLSTGSPMVINDADFDVEELVPEDLPDESLETVRYLIGQVGLNRTAAHLYFLHCSPLRLNLSREASTRENAMRDINSSLEAWKVSQHAIFASSGGSHYLNLTIKVCYNYYLINLTQRLQRQVPKSESQNSPSSTQIIEAATAVFSLVDDSLLYWSQEYFPMIYVSALFSAMVVLAVDAVPLAERPNGDQLLRTIRPGLLALKQFESMYVLARWIRNFFMSCLVRWDREGQRSREVSPGAQAQRSDGQDVAIPASLAPDSGFGPPIVNSSVTQSNLGFTNVPAQGMGPAAGLEALAGYMIGQDSGQQQGEPGRGERAYWSGYLAGDSAGFPVPESNQYQAMYFLADLGMPWVE